jgi:transporter family protein
MPGADRDFREDRHPGGDFDLATLIRTAIIIIVLSAFVAYTGKWSNPIALPAKTWLFLGLSGIATGASWVCYFRALQIGEASKVAPVEKLSLVLVAVFAVAFLDERPSLREWAVIGMVADGVLPLTFSALSWQRAAGTAKCRR